LEKAIERGKEIQKEKEPGEYDRKNILDRRFGDHPICVEHERRTGKDRRYKPPAFIERIKAVFLSFIHVFRRKTI
jgi:hypothetical protein